MKVMKIKKTPVDSLVCHLSVNYLYLGSIDLVTYRTWSIWNLSHTEPSTCRTWSL